jgi:hypothetical protein
MGFVCVARVGRFREFFVTSATASDPGIIQGFLIRGRVLAFPLFAR